jgi:hypothetical protein
MAAAAYAQDATPQDETDGTDSVLQKARDKYDAQKESDNAAEEVLLSPSSTPAPEASIKDSPAATSSPSAATSPTASPEPGFDLEVQEEPFGVPPVHADDKKNFPEKETPYSPVLFSFSPGLSIPWGGPYRTNLALGVIGVDSADVFGLSFGGLFSTVKGDLSGVQFAGISSVATGAALGWQGSGVVSVAQDMWGAQTAGVVCSARDVRGLQLSGVINSAKDVWGAQVSGLVNSARVVRGTQIGLINLSESMYGIPIGLFSYTKNGIRDVGLYFDSYGRDYAFVTTGTNNFYVFAYDIIRQNGGWNRPSLDDFGLGAGYRIIERPLRLDVDLSARLYPTGYASFTNAYGATFKVVDGLVLPMARCTLALPLGKRFELFCGITVDTIVDGFGLDGLTPSVYGSFQFYDHQVLLFPAVFAGFRF